MPPNHSIQFHQYHLEDMGRVRVRKTCDLEDREIPQSEIGKGYEDAKDQVVAISDEELQELPLPTAKAIEIQAFVPLEAIDPIRIAEGYYLVPDGQVAAKPYKLLRQVLDRSSKVAIAKYAWSGRERLGLLRLRDDAIVLHAMRWPDEVRDPAALDPPHETVSEEEIKGALALMESMSRDNLDGPEFEGTYTDALAKIIESKREDKPLPEAPEPEQPGKVLDLMAALTESVQQAKASAARTPTSSRCRRRRPRRSSRPRRRQRRRRRRADRAAPDTPQPVIGKPRQAPPPGAPAWTFRKPSFSV
ncbi:Ku protein [Streptomyces canus]|uniref:non-homologous end joining protein Ku n=1 Tax=Streptomyces canus TaxID=58343 RepID=UPI0033D0EBF3